MMTIKILPKDVEVAWMPEVNAFEIKINKETMLEKETGDLLMGNLFEGFEDIVTCQEINPGTDDWFIYDGQIYVLTPKDYAELKETGKTIMSNVGKLKDNVDLDVDSDKEFVLWYFNSADTIEEAIQMMNATKVLFGSMTFLEHQHDGVFKAIVHRIDSVQYLTEEQANDVIDADEYDCYLIPEEYKGEIEYECEKQ